MRLNLKGWKKVGVVDGQTVMQNEAGHKLHIAHKSLSAKLRAGLESLPTAYAEGGEVQSEQKPVVINIGQPQPNASQMPVMPQFSPVEQIQQAAAQVNPNETTLEAKKAQLDMMAPPVAPAGMDRSAEIEKQAVSQTLDDKEAADAVQKQAAMQAATKVQQQSADIAIQNAQRAKLGLPPIPMPSSAAPVAAMSSVAQTANSMPAGSPQAAPSGNQMHSDNIAAPAAIDPSQTGYEMANAGHINEAKALGQLGEDKARIQQQAAQQSEKLLGTYKNTLNDLETSRKELAKSVLDQKIDPDRFWSNKSVPSKISTVLGLILGGMGGGLLHQENPALKLLNHQIEQDIDAQKSNLNKTEGLLKMNMQHFNNIQQATDMTRIMMNDAVNHKIETAIAKSVDPQAKAKLQQILGERIQTNQAAQQKLAINRTFDQYMSGEGKDPNKLPALISAMRQVDPKRAEELQAQHVPGMGLATTPKGAEKLRELKGTIDAAKNGLSELVKISKMSAKSISPELKARAEVIAGTLQGLLRVPITGPGAVSDTERKMLTDMIADPTKILTLDNSNRTRLSTLMERLDISLDMAGKAEGIPPVHPILKLEPKDQQIAMWAKRNPQDPRAAAALQALGIK